VITARVIILKTPEFLYDVESPNEIRPPGETNAMNRIPVVALAVVSTAALATLLFEQPAFHRVFAASPAQVQSEPLKTGQTQPPAQNQQPGKVVLIAPNGPPLTPIEQLGVQVLGLQMELKELQAQVNTLQNQSSNDANSIHALQTSLQTLQTQFANHSHKVTTVVPGHVCTGIDTFLVTDAATGQQRRVGLEITQPCSNPKWDGATPSSWQALNVSTPVQGAQTPQ
jgi:FtsZ-binding cell division protein ZapB